MSVVARLPGLVVLDRVPCPWCRGRGIVEDLPDPPPVPRGDTTLCPACGGTGEVEVYLEAGPDGVAAGWHPVGERLTEEARAYMEEAAGAR